MVDFNNGGQHQMESNTQGSVPTDRMHSLGKFDKFKLLASNPFSGPKWQNYTFQFFMHNEPKICTEEVG